LELLSAESFDVIFCDYSDRDEKEVLYKARDMQPSPCFIDMVKDEEEADEATKERTVNKRKIPSADTVIPWEFSSSVIKKALLKCPKAPPPALPTPPPPNGRNGPGLLLPKDIERLVDPISANDKPVLVCGEPGTGKRTLARRIHDASPRGKAGGLFREFQCPPMDVQTMESELFGHKAGAFSWATCDRPGLLQQTDGGTLLFKNIDQLSLEMQRKLLALIEDPLMRVVYLGGRESVSVNVRIMATVTEPLQLRPRGTFSTDLFFLLSENYLELAPLRTRIGELRKFVDCFIPGDIEIVPAAMEVFKRYPWPANLEELKNALRFAHLRCNNRIEINDLPGYLVAATSRLGGG